MSKPSAKAAVMKPEYRSRVERNKKKYKRPKSRLKYENFYSGNDSE